MMVIAASGRRRLRLLKCPTTTPSSSHSVGPGLLGFSTVLERRPEGIGAPFICGALGRAAAASRYAGIRGKMAYRA